MKIGILTHPQSINYGGILQCYALSTYLRKEGHDVIVIRRENNSPTLKRIVRQVLKIFHIKPYYNKDEAKKGSKIKDFVNKQLVRTPPIYSQQGMQRICSKYRLNTLIVGSDQVWRRSFALKYGYNYFLDFATSDVIKLSYAASFGLSEWQYSPEETRIIKNLISEFKAVSVREDEAVSLCLNNLSQKAQQVLDPTLLLKKEDYIAITSPRLIEQPYLFVYWLGDKSRMDEAINSFKGQYDGRIKVVNLRETPVLPSVEDWLSYIMNADMVLTDSFHGCAFSIIFNRPLSVFSNESGGIGRINSLLKMLGITGDIIEKEDYENINKKIGFLKNDSELYLKKYIQ